MFILVFVGSFLVWDYFKEYYRNPYKHLIENIYFNVDTVGINDSFLINLVLTNTTSSEIKIKSYKNIGTLISLDFISFCDSFEYHSDEKRYSNHINSNFQEIIKISSNDSIQFLLEANVSKIGDTTFVTINELNTTYEIFCNGEVKFYLRGSWIPVNLEEKRFEDIGYGWFRSNYIYIRE